MIPPGDGLFKWIKLYHKIQYINVTYQYVNARIERHLWRLGHPTTERVMTGIRPGLLHVPDERSVIRQMNRGFCANTNNSVPFQTISFHVQSRTAVS
jgi:hypothetical protein